MQRCARPTTTNLKLDQSMYSLIFDRSANCSLSLSLFLSGKKGEGAQRLMKEATKEREGEVRLREAECREIEREL